MGTRITLPIAGQTSKGSILQINAQRSINCYPETQQPGAKASLVLKSSPGLTRLAIGDYPTRSNYVPYRGKLYFVQGQYLKYLDALWNIHDVGAIETTGGFVSIAAGRTSLFLVDGQAGYYTNGAGTTLTKVLDADLFNHPYSCCYINSFFVVNNRTSDKFAISGIEDPSTWDALDFAQADKAPDDCLAVAATLGDLYAIGETTTQVYYYSGNADFPFDLYSNGLLEYGTEAPDSIGESEGALFMLGKSKKGGRVVIMMRGFQAQKISHSDIDDQIERMSKVDDAEGFAYIQGGRTFYEITFPSEDVTLVYNVDERAWHERKSYGIGRHRVRGHGYYEGKHVVGDYENGNIYHLDVEAYSENGDPLERTRITSVIGYDRRRISLHSYEAEVNYGAGLLGEDAPLMTMKYSKDGGKTWSNDQTASIGAHGEYGARAVFRNFGVARQFIVHLTVTDPVDLSFINSYADATIHPS